MTTENLPDFIQQLLDPGSYPHPVTEIRLVQTHISYVLLAGDFVYKIKKPVDFGFLDFTTLEKRKFFCEQELVLNQRLCPDLYLSTVAINSLEGAYSFDGPGEPVEYAVKMLRMPEARMMGRIIASGGLTEGMLGRIVDILVPFYEKAAGGPEINEFGRVDSVSVNVLENFQQTENFVGCDALSPELFKKVSDYARQFMARKDLFDSRIAAGRVRDCHGDLYSANICLADKVYIFDCIEFNNRFRYSDVASDVAFLSMDLDFHGLEKMSSLFIDSFVKQSGDQGLVEVLDFYKCYRAYVRGKIGLFTAHAPEVDEATKGESLYLAGKYFALAGRYAEDK